MDNEINSFNAILVEAIVQPEMHFYLLKNH